MIAAHPRDCVLITRAAAAGRQTASRIVAMGLSPVLAPLTELQPGRIDWPAGKVQAVLATSGNAIAALPEQAFARPLLTVGDATAARAIQAGHTQVCSAGADASALAALAALRLRPGDGALLLASGEGQGRALATALRGQGFRVCLRTAYAVRAAAHMPAPAIAALRGNRLGAALFFSPAGAKLFAALLGASGLDIALLADVAAVAISPATARGVAHLPWRHIRVASHPTQDEMLALLQ